jgi:tetratricopeptide (TPR) repeat protein
MTRKFCVVLFSLFVLIACAAPTADDHIAAGRAALAAGKVAEAITSLEAAVALDPTRGDAQVLLGRAYYADGRSDEARQRLQTGLSQTPGDAEGQYLYGDLLMEANNTLEAALAYAQAVRVDGAGRSAHPRIDETIEPALDAGEQALEGGQVDAAIRYLEAVVALAPNHLQAQFTLGNAYATANKILEAQAAYQAALRIDAEYAPALTNLGVMAYRINDLERAIGLFQQALAIDAQDAETHYLLGAAFLNLDRREEATAEFLRALEIDADLNEASIGLGNVYLLSEEYDRAIEILEQVRAKLPASPETLFALGKAYYAVDRKDDARNTLQDFLNANPVEPFRTEAQKILTELGAAP